MEEHLFIAILKIPLQCPTQYVIIDEESLARDIVKHHLQLLVCLFPQQYFLSIELN